MIAWCFSYEDRCQSCSGMSRIRRSFFLWLRLGFMEKEVINFEGDEEEWKGGSKGRRALYAIIVSTADA